MRYFVCSDRDGNLNVLSIYDSEDGALKRLKYHVKKEKCILKIVPLPEISVGCRLYHKDGAYYGTIAYETNTLWGISEDTKSGAMPNPYSKKRIDGWIIGRDFIVLDGVEFINLDDVANMTARLDFRVEEALKKFEYIYTEQVALL